MAAREIVKAIPRGPSGGDGAMGPRPDHVWDGPRLKFQKSDGTYGEEVNLLGPEGPAGAAQNFTSKVQAAAHSITIGLAYVRTAAQGLYRLLASAPVAPDERNFTSVDGQHWELAEKNPDVEMIDAVGDGATNNDSSFDTAELMEQAAIGLPDGNFKVSAGKELKKRYLGSGTYLLGREPYPFNRPETSLRDAMLGSIGRVGNLVQLNKAVASGTVVMTFVGDSICEGQSQIDYQDSWPGRVGAWVRRILRNVTVVENNLSIPGTSIGELNSNTYVGAAAPVPGVSFNAAAGWTRSPPNEVLWPSGTTNGVTWNAHVQATAPDVLALAPGMNDVLANNTDAVIATLDSFIVNKVGIWAKVPSILLVTPMLPSEQHPTPNARVHVQAVADAMRSYAEQKNLTLIDANRLFHSYTEGVDIVDQRRHTERDFSDYANWVTVNGVRPTLAANVLTLPSFGVVARPSFDRDIDLAGNIAVSGANAVGFWARQDPADVNKAYVLQVEANGGSPQIVLYFNSVAISSGAIAGVSPWRVHYQIRGARHVAWVNGAKVMDIYDYKRLYTGRYGIGGSAGSVAAFSARGTYPFQQGPKALTEYQVLAPADDFLSNEYSQGGHPINHPSIAGHMMYFAAFGPFFRALERMVNRALPRSVVAKSGVQTLVMGLGDFVAVTIDGEASAEISLGGGTSTDIATAAFHAKKISNANSCQVKVVKNGVSDQIILNVTLPAVSNWLIHAEVSVTWRSANGARANLVVTAIEAD